tara:strand:- start:17610 stop:18173 length:564 start_codon:yes stop_codon:yes gene_type:complete
MQKKELRKVYKNKRAELPSSERSEAGNKILKQIREKWNFAGKKINIFLPIDRLLEINTYPLVEYFSESNQVCSPVSDFATLELKHVELTKETKIELSEWGIPEPRGERYIQADEIDVIIVPLLISDTKGYRLGYGKGFYDRFLAQCNERSLFIGINYFEPIEKMPGIDQCDIPLHYLVTPEKIYQSE